MKTLDQLAMEVKALTAKIQEFVRIIDKAEQHQARKAITRGKLVHQAYTLIEKATPNARDNSVAKYQWCKKAGISEQTAYMARRIGKADDPEDAFIHQRNISRSTSARTAARTREQAVAGRLAMGRNTFAGAFAIMVQGMGDETPEDFMGYDSVCRRDVRKLLDFLSQALYRKAA